MKTTQERSCEVDPSVKQRTFLNHLSFVQFVYKIKYLAESFILDYIRNPFLVYLLTPVLLEFLLY